MKLVYTNENRFLVENAKNILENAGFAVQFKNEFASGGAGELAPIETWLELWLVNDEDYAEATALLTTSFSEADGHDWVCRNCHETNDASFDYCWNCQHDKPANNKE